MIIDKDSHGNITIAELTPGEAETLQIAALAISENQSNDTEQSRFLRRLAMQIDNLLTK